MLGIQREEGAGELAQFAEIQQALVAALRQILQRVLEQRSGQPFHHFAKAGDQAAVGIPHQTRIAGLAQQAGQGGIAQADVEQSLHHAWHGDGRTGAHRHDQRLARVAKQVAGGLLQRRNAGVEQRADALLAMVGIVRAQHQGGGHGQAGLRHAQQVEGLGAHGVAVGRNAVAHEGRVVGLAGGSRVGDQVEVVGPGKGMVGRHAGTPVFRKAIWRSA